MSVFLSHIFLWEKITSITDIIQSDALHSPRLWPTRPGRYKHQTACPTTSQRRYYEAAKLQHVYQDIVCKIRTVLSHLHQQIPAAVTKINSCFAIGSKCPRQQMP